MPSDTIIQYVTQQGSLVAAFFVLVCIVIAVAVVTLGVVIDRYDQRRQRELDEHTLIDPQTDSDEHWADKMVAGGRHDRA